MTISRAMHRSVRDFTMVKAGLLVVLLALVPLLGLAQQAGGAEAAEGKFQPQVIRALLWKCDDTGKAGPLI